MSSTVIHGLNKGRQVPLVHIPPVSGADHALLTAHTHTIPGRRAGEGRMTAATEPEIYCKLYHRIGRINYSNLVEIFSSCFQNVTDG